MGDEFFATTIIPVFGPFITMNRIESNSHNKYLKGSEELFTLSGILQMSFATFFVYTLLNVPETEQIARV